MERAAPPKNAAKLDVRSWAFLFDFDGTLVDIAEAPDQIEVPPDLGSHLAALAERVGGALAVITGRRIADIDYLLLPHRLDVAGVHGAELRVAARLLPAAPSDPALAEIGSAAADRFKPGTGILIEDKGSSVAIHWRRQPRLEREVVSFLASAARKLGSGYRIQRGKAVAEILQRSATKGAAIGRIMATSPYIQRRPLYFGDDLTDESAFDAVNRVGGASVRIGIGPTCALFSLPHVQALRRRLAFWAKGGPVNLRKDFFP